MQTTYDIKGMHCQACVAKIDAALRSISDNVSVTLTPPAATIETDERPSLGALNDVLAARAGAYTLSEKPNAVTPPSSMDAAPDTETFSSCFPLFVIMAYIAIVAFAGTANIAGGIDWSRWMTNVMAGFFLVFSGFKFLNLEGFADAYATYDLLAKRWHGYGYIYPFLELALGLAFLFQVQLTTAHLVTIVLMGFSSLGVIGILRQNRRIQCACLGTVLKLPMSTITLVEDLGMVAMAALALIIH